MLRYFAASLTLLLAGAAQAQPIRFALTADSSAVNVATNVQYAMSDTTSLRMDVYSPKSGARTGRAALVFFNRAVGANRANPFYVAWARAAAARGLVAVVPDLRATTDTQDFRVLVRYLNEHAADIGFDRGSIVAYAGSGNVFSALPAVQNPAMTDVAAAVMYYGTAPITQFRLDLPVLFVRAGLDRPALNRELTTLVALASTQNAPVTLLNHHTGYHGFESANDDDATRDVMEQTIAFVKRTAAAGYRAALAAGIGEARAAGYVLDGKPGLAAAIYRDLVAARPDDARLRLSYGEALLGDGQFAAACDELEKLKGKGLGPRDLGLPAARACAQRGDPEKAIAWLNSIPARFLPVAVRDEPVFAPLKSRPDFLAVFARRQ